MTLPASGQPRHSGVYVVIALLATVYSPLLAQTGPSASGETAINASELLRQVREIAAAFDSTSDANTERLEIIPRSWHVVEAGHSFEIATDPLADVVRELQTTGTVNPARQKQALGWLHALESTVRTFADETPQMSTAHRELDAVLATREFRGVRGPDAFEITRARLLRWLLDLFGRIRGSSAFSPVRGLFVYALIILSVIAVAIAFYRSLRNGPASASLASVAETLTPREWRDWRRDVDAAIQRGEWRNAVHAAYWCAVSLLEARGAWRQDRARTPRDYPPLLASDPPSRDLLVALTGQFERTWYGRQPVDHVAADNALDALEQLGCPRS